MDYHYRSAVSGRHSIAIVVILILVCFGSSWASEWGGSDLESGQFIVGETSVPLNSLSITQSVDPNVLEVGSVACVDGGVTRDTGYRRLFDLDVEFGLIGTFCTTDVDYGIESSSGPQTMTVNVSCLDDGLPFLEQFLVPSGTATVNQPDAVLEFFNIEVTGCCNSEDQSMSVELLSEDCVENGVCSQLFIGSNSLGQSADSYISADDCGLSDPAPLDDVGFPEMHVVMVVNGNDASCEGSEVCDGSCPESYTCVNSKDSKCFCLFTGSCSSTIHPTCDGDCPAFRDCEPQEQGECECVFNSGPCNAAPYGTCGEGDCPQGQTCRPKDLGFCLCEDEDVPVPATSGPWVTGLVLLMLVALGSIVLGRRRLSI